ncbi:MAG: anthrone oxygenase family protein [Betaproteobacteria bacterium]
MLDALQILALNLAALAMVPALAHALELPGKKRLAKDEYFAVQTIYYPGFTIAGMSEPLAMLATAALLLFTPGGGLDFWLTLLALAGLIGMQAVYWLVTHPVNKFWLQGESLSGIGSGFFSFASAGGPERKDEARPTDWMDLRDRWEHSHVARAGLSAASFIGLALAASLG